MTSETLQSLNRSPPRAHAFLLPATQARHCHQMEMLNMDSPSRRHVEIDIYDGDCIAIAKQLQLNPGAKVWILNMANAYKAGGGARSECSVPALKL